MAEQGGRRAQHGDLARADFPDQALGAQGPRRQQMRRSPREQGAEQGPQTGRHRGWIEQRGAVIRVQTEAPHRVLDIVQQRPVDLERALGRPGRAGGVEHIGEVFGRRRRRHRRWFGAGLQAVDLDHAFVRVEQGARPPGHGGDGRHADRRPMAGDQPVAGVGMVGIEGDHAAARGHGAEQRGGGAHVVRPQDGDGTGAIQALVQGGGDAQDKLRQLTVGEGCRSVLHRDAPSMAPRGFQETADDGLHGAAAQPVSPSFTGTSQNGNHCRRLLAREGRRRLRWRSRRRHAVSWRTS